MTLTTEQQEKIVRLRAKSTKLKDELKNIIISNVVLTPTKEQGIANINAEILSYINHVGMTRDEYVAVVQPLKNQRRDLIHRNEIIHRENNVLKQAAQQQYEVNRSDIQQQIDSNEVKLLNAIKIVDLSKMMLK